MKDEHLEHHFLTESEALRLLNWPSSRRKKLRELVPHQEMAFCFVYLTSQVREFQEKLNAHATFN